MSSNKKIVSIPIITQSSGKSSKTSNLSIHSVFKNQNLGNNTLLTTIPIFDFFSISKVANKEESENGELIAQRNLDLNHSKKLAVYILKGMVSSAMEQRKQEGKTPLNKTNISFNDFTGQAQVLENLEIFVKAANLRGEALDHTLFHC